MKPSEILEALTDWRQGVFVPADTSARMCFCVGPQNGEPVCPCRMSRLTIRNGRYVEVIDHGPAPAREDDSSD